MSSSKSSGSVSPVVGSSGNVVVSQGFAIGDYEAVLDASKPASKATVAGSTSAPAGGLDLNRLFVLVCFVAFLLVEDCGLICDLCNSFWLC